MMGDGLMAVFGAPPPLPDHATRAVRAALEMVELVDLFNGERAALGKPPIAIGVGIASGEMVAGYAGTQRAGDLHLHRRHREPGRAAGAAHQGRADAPILIDGATRARLAADVGVEALGPVQFKGKATQWRSLRSPRGRVR